MKVEDKLALNKFEIDKEVHIQVEEKLCPDCDLKPCLYVCPAECYQLRENHVTFSYEGCLECGSCRLACDRQAIRWVYPRGGFGICYQYG
ncbi:MAG TPA: ferredoxin family protein [Thermodesulfobacteriota bacterium]|nr:ferredoxin family protein [Thermodesulfobacteriota bacterium]